MKQTKMNLANIQGKLSRTEMKNIMAGDAPPGCGTGISCKDKEEFDICGSAGTCSCTYVANGGSIMYCRSGA